MRSPHSTRWDVYRDSDGNPVTVDCNYGHYDEIANGPLSSEQIKAVRHAAETWHEICQEMGSDQSRGAYEDGKWLWSSANMAKSRLLYWMIHAGGAPHDYPPPHHSAGGWWELIEDGSCLLNLHMSTFELDGITHANILGGLWQVLGGDIAKGGLILKRPFVPFTERWVVRPATQAECDAQNFQANLCLERMNPQNVFRVDDFLKRSAWDDHT